MSAARNISGLRPWQKGQSGNPSGRTRLPEELRAIRALTQEEVTRLVSKYARMAPDQLDLLVEARIVPMLELSIAKILQEAAKKGDWQRLGFLLDRAIGKVKEAEPLDAESEVILEIESLSDQELVKLVKEKMPAFEPQE